MEDFSKLVSCIMPTCNRRAFVPYAISYFLQQDYSNKELIIVDDGTDAVEDLVPDHESIRYIRIKKTMTLGEKRNYCIRQSRGALIMHWDDDDWMAPNRISYQVAEMEKQHAEVCGLQQMYYYEISTGICWLYRYPPNARPWLAGNSLLYTREFWCRGPFPNRQVASDTQFIFSRNLNRYVALANHSFYVATVHPENTSFKQTGSSLWKLVDKEEILGLLGGTWPPEAGAVPVERKVKPVNRFPVIAPQTVKGAVSACLLSYKRPANMQKIVNSLQRYSFITEIIIWNNNPGYPLQVTGDKVRVIHARENTICYGRFLCAAEALNDYIYFQDDDAVVTNVAELYETFLRDPQTLTYCLAEGHYKIKEKFDFHNRAMAFLGWGSFIRKEWLSLLNDYLENGGYSQDTIFRREADKMFTLMLGKKHRSIPARLQILPMNSLRGIALYLEKDHNLMIALAIRKALAYARMHAEPNLPVTWNVVITCKDYGRFLEEAVLSVVRNHADYCITIVDDASTDNTREVCSRLVKKYPFIQYLRNDEVMGVGHARNQGLAATESLFAILLDADDRIGPGYLFEAEKILRKGADVVNPDAILFGTIQARWNVPETVTLGMQLHKNHVHCCAAFRRLLWEKIGGVDEQMLNWQDYEFWIRMAAAGAVIRRIPGDHFYYRKHGHSKSSVSRHRRETIMDYIREKHASLFEQVSI